MPDPKSLPEQRIDLFSLPSELHLQLLSFLNYRDLQMLRSTNRYFWDLPSSTDISKARKAYVRELVEVEKEEADHSWRAGDEDLSEDSTPIYFLNCYSCLRRLPVTHFSNTQTTRRRSRGHLNAAKRFCKDCGLRGKWQPGVVLDFPDRVAVYCTMCLQLGDADKLPIPSTLCHRCRELVRATRKEALSPPSQHDWDITERFRLNGDENRR